MRMYSLTEEDFIGNAEAVKVTVIRSLINDGYLKEDEAQEWAESHTVLIKRPNMFQSIVNKIKNKITDNTYIVVEIV